MESNKKKIIVIGSVGYDQKILLDILLEEIPEIGGTKIANIEISLGGKGNIEAVACARTDGETTFLGAVGEKDYDNLFKHFYDNNVTPILKKAKNVPSHTACILIDKEKKHRIVVDPRAGNSLDKKFINSNIDIINKSSFILLQLEIDFLTVNYIITNYKGKKTIILRPSPLQENQLERVRKLIKDLNYLILNEGELGLISGEETKTQEQIEAACDKIIKCYKPINVIVPILDKGWLLWNREKGKKIFQAYDVGNVIDKVGFIDCFIGVFASFLSREYDIDEAIRYANLASSISSTREGTITSLPNYNELRRYINIKLPNWE